MDPSLPLNSPCWPAWPAPAACTPHWASTLLRTRPLSDARTKSSHSSCTLTATSTKALKKLSRRWWQRTSGWWTRSSGERTIRRCAALSCPCTCPRPLPTRPQWRQWPLTPPPLHGGAWSACVQPTRWCSSCSSCSSCRRPGHRTTCRPSCSASRRSLHSSGRGSTRPLQPQPRRPNARRRMTAR